MPNKLPMLADNQAKEILTTLCTQHGVSIELLTSMLNVQRENLGRGRQHGITEDFSALIQDFLDEKRR
jgi:hypothetical protein